MSASKNVSAHTLKSDLTRLDPRAIDYGRFSELAAGLAQLDRSAYAAIGKDPLMPVMGLGLPDAPLCIMGRDPGRADIAAGAPFMGASGRVLHRLLLSQAAPQATGANAPDPAQPSH